jgi:hypothetical protein
VSSSRGPKTVPSLTLSVEIADLPPGGHIPEHHHGGPTLDYVISGAAPAGSKRSDRPDRPALDHLAAALSPTEPAKIMLIHIADDGAQLWVMD